MDEGHGDEGTGTGGAPGTGAVDPLVRPPVIVRPDTLPQTRPVDMDGTTVELDPPTLALSWWDRAWAWLFGILARGLRPEGDRL